MKLNSNAEHWFYCRQLTYTSYILWINWIHKSYKVNRSSLLQRMNTSEVNATISKFIIYKIIQINTMEIDRAEIITS